MDFWVTVVDDEALCLTNARNLLGDEGIKVSCLKSGQDLLKFVQKNTPDLVLLDVMMPGLDGFETLKRLRGFEDQNGRTHIPVIFLTGENDAKAEQRGLALGASDFIRKPFNKEILLRRIDNTIKNKKTIELLTEEAKKDKLTGFWNKTRGTERIGQLCRQKSGTLLIMDLDNFKLVNDLFGHDMGDKVLQAFADIIRRNTREYDTISRIGGDEFLAFIEDLTDESYVASETIQLNADFAKQARCLLGEEHGLPLGISVGAVMVPKHGREYEELFSMVDSALHSVKQNGKHGYSIYDRTDMANDAERTDLEQEIERLSTIVEERNEGGGGLLLGREDFSTVYRFTMRFYKRYGGASVRILFSLKAKEENGKGLAETGVAFGRFLQKELRRSDLIMQHRTNQFFVVLNERTKFEADVVIQRILTGWEASGLGKGVLVELSFRSTDYPAGRKE